MHHPAPPHRWRRHALALLLGCSALGAAQAADPASDRAELERLRATTQALIETLVSQGLVTRERADAILRQAGASAAPAGPGWGSPLPAASATAAAPVVRVPYLSETQRAQLRDEIRNDVLATARSDGWADARQIPEWVRGIRFEGDLRLRAQSERYPEPAYALDATTGLLLGDACSIVAGNLPARCYRRQVSSPAWAPDIADTTNGRNRLTLRARLGLQARISGDFTGQLRLSTGSATGGPSSSTQTLGNYFNKSSVVIDRALVQWEPRHDMRLQAGRIGNPFFSSDLTWPDDIGFDGVAAQGELTLAPGAFAFAHAGVFALQELSLDRDRWLTGLQVGAQWAFNAHGTLRLGVAMYDFARVEGVRETNPPPGGERAGTEPYFSSQYPAGVRQKGNTLINLNDPASTAAPTWGLASKFRPINITAQLDYRLSDRLAMAWSLDWLRNTGFDLADIRRRAGTPAVDGLAEKTDGLQTRWQIGSPALNTAGQWRLSAALRRFERDAWLDAFTDTTWHLGGTNYKGWQLVGQYAIDSRAVLGLRLTSSRNLDDGVRTVNAANGAVESSFSNAPLKIDVLQLDLSTRF
ncbi:putative porin [Pseudaquabacterium pictum]|uniref:Uncharacterized protein n=1 Tax=Pseudaquabacterium pictum TaxID=2315236 RepID=A0A480AMM2_9BURK|nr:putative porin [Rubrivivax pictus]GCL62919.1 hypothetical protein AQPW35_20000 [Rubrivivax pictus]